MSTESTGAVEFDVRPHPILPRDVRSWVGDVVTLIIPCLIVLEFEEIGRLFISELILLATLPFLLSTQASRLNTPVIKKLLLLGLVWLLSQMITDVVRDTPFEDWSRGWAKICFFLIDFVALYLLIANQRKRLFLYVFGIATGQVISYIFAPNIYAVGAPWKWGYGPAVSILIMLSTQLRIMQSIRWLPEFAVGIASALNFALGARALGAVIFCALILAFVRTRTSSARRRPRTRSVVFASLGMVLVLGIGAYTLSEIYETAALKGWLGDEAQTKFQFQSSGDFGFLLGGRTEILSSSQAVIDSPLLGHGSWAKNPIYSDIRFERLIELGYSVERDIENESDLIPTHSYLMGAWVEAGVLGAVFWLWILALAFRMLIAGLRSRDSIAVIVDFFILSLIWSIIFSPFGALSRLEAAFSIAIVLFVHQFDLSLRAIRATGR